MNFSPKYFGRFDPDKARWKKYFSANLSPCFQMIEKEFEQNEQY